MAAMERRFVVYTHTKVCVCEMRGSKKVPFPKPPFAASFHTKLVFSVCHIKLLPHKAILLGNCDGQFYCELNFAFRKKNEVDNVISLCF